jgi:hypothetical protein
MALASQKGGVKVEIDIRIIYQLYYLEKHFFYDKQDILLYLQGKFS